MKRVLIAVFAVLALSGIARSADIILPGETSASVYFSPRGGAQSALIAEIDRAKDQILVMAYNFTSPEIGAALVRAHARGVKVEAILDKRANATDARSQAQALISAGVPVYFDGRHPIMHDKVMIFDTEAVATGSFNFTKGAEEKNAENLLIVRAGPLVWQYAQDWQRHREHAE